MSATSGFEGKLASIALQFRIWPAEPADTEMLAEEVSPLQLELCRLSALQLCTAVMLIQDLQSNPALATEYNNNTNIMRRATLLHKKVAN